MRQLLLSLNRMKRLILMMLPLMLFSPRNVYAGLVDISPQGNVTWNVLAVEDDSLLTDPRSELEIKEIAQNTSQTNNATVVLNKADGGVNLSVVSDTGRKNVVLENWNDSIVEIEERPEVQKVTIGLEDGRFRITQNDVTAVTDLPITIDSGTAKITITTDTGDQIIGVLPYQALQSVVRMRIINKTNSDNTVALEEKAGRLVYKITGEKVVNILNVLDYNVPVSTHVSAFSGEVISVDQPVWLRLVGFMFE